MKRSILAFGLVAGLTTGAAFAQDGTADSPEGLFKSLDKDQNGLLTADEVPAAQTRFFARLARIGDKNGDGQLSQEEFVAGLNAADRPVANPEANRPGDGRGLEQFLEMLKRMDANGDGKISRAEVPERAREQMQRLFERAGSDEIDLKQFAERARQSQGQGQPGNFPRPPILAALDANGDRRISKDEFARAGEKFAELDRNGDGFLDPQEILGAPPPGSPLSGMPAAGQRQRPGQPGERARDVPDVDQLLTRLDKDGDGALSESEAPERMKSRFSDIDRNGDGKLSKEELRSALPGAARERRPRRPE